MADKTIDSELIHLIDNWPSGPIEKDLGFSPLAITSAAAGFNQATPSFEPGTRLGVFNTPTAAGAGKRGPAVFIYLQVGTQDTGTAIAAKSVVVQDSATLWYQVTNDPDSCVLKTTGCGAIALGAVTDAYWAWFWCGGVCPEYFVSGLGGNYATDSTVDVGAFTTGDLTADAIGLVTAATDEGVFGFALAADAA